MVAFIANGAIAQLGERYNGIVEVVGSIPSSSTKKLISLIKAINFLKNNL